MSLGYSVSDIASLVKSAWTFVQNTRKAQDEYNEVDLEAENIYIVVKRLQEVLSRPHSLLQQEDSSCRDELRSIIKSCRRDLDEYSGILKKYNLAVDGKSLIWKWAKRAEFGNVKVPDLPKFRSRAAQHSHAITVFMLTLQGNSLARIEQGFAKQAPKLDRVFARLEGSEKCQSEWTAFSPDETKWWKTFAAELRKEGVGHDFINNHKEFIIDYLYKKAQQGVFDDPPIDERVEVEPGVAVETKVKAKLEAETKFETETEVHIESGDPSSNTTALGRYSEDSSDTYMYMSETDSETDQNVKNVRSAAPVSALLWYFPYFILRKLLKQKVDDSPDPEWPSGLLEKMQNPISFEQLSTILEQHLVPEEHMRFWMILFSMTARKKFDGSPLAGVIIMEEGINEYNWHFGYRYQEQVEDWASGIYKKYSEELELFRLACREEYWPPSSEPQRVIISGGTIIVRALERTRTDVEGLRELTRQYEF